MNKKIVAIAMAMAIVTSNIGVIAYANPYESDYNEKNNEYESAQEKVDEINAKIQKLDNEISNLIVEIDETNGKIAKTEDEIDNTKENVKQTEDNMVEEEELFNQRMRAMYMNGMDSYIEVILNSEGVSDLVSRVENVKELINYDKELMTELTSKKVTLEKQKSELEDKKAELVALKEGIDNKRKDLQVMKEGHNKEFKEARAKRDELQAKVNELEKLKESYVETPSRGGSDDSYSSNDSNSGNGDYTNSDTSDNQSVNPPVNPPSSSASGQAIVDYAYNFLGIAYVWGGNDPSGFDCSGLTQYVYAKFGIDITRTTYTQIGQGSYVSRDQLVPGDLVFFGYGSPDHVGIYVGGNQYLHAPESGDVVKVSPMTRSDYMTARRIVY
ncbi:NlpC/P60 family protein [Clostridium sp. UBA6640]|uniref:C40 family peptidase n=1 Tax=Clostridium sp. UBA6640 TaxID=1946370 RepID=UPI0025C267D5|nr:C40 family peptidase [Clostridium sp. UBA6640]